MSCFRTDSVGSIPITHSIFYFYKFIIKLLIKIKIKSIICSGNKRKESKKMNLKKELSNNEIGLLTKAGVNVEDKEYTKEELKKCEFEIEEFILSHSSKNGDIDKLHNEYNAILQHF